MPVPHVDFTDERLPNGLRLIVAEDHLAPVVAVNLWYDVGSKHEQPGKTGFAHLFEHVMFQGSRARREGGAHRARPGRRRHDERHDLARPDELLRDAAVATSWSSRCGSRPTAWRRSSTRSARRTSTTSARSSRTRSAGRTTTGRTARWNEKLQAHLFPPDHPYHHPTIGSMDDLDAASLEDVSAFFRTYYAPNNAVLSRRRRRRPRRRCAHGSSSTSGASRPTRRSRRCRDLSLPAVLGEEVREVVPDRVPLPRVYFGFRAPVFGDPRLDALDIAGQILAGGKGSRLHRRLVRDERLAQDVALFALGFLGGASICGRLGHRPARRRRRRGRGRLPRGARAAGDASSSSDDELARAKALIEADELGALARVEERADRLSMYATLFDDPDLINRMLPRYLSVTAEQIRDVARGRLPSGQPRRPDVPPPERRRGGSHAGGAAA